MNTFTQIITIAAPAAAALAGVDRVMTGLTASKAISSGAAVQVAQVAQGVTPPASDPLSSSPAGVSLPSTPDVAGEGV